MRELTLMEVDEVSGAVSASDIGYAIGYAVGSVYTAITDFGSGLGAGLYDATHC